MVFLKVKLETGSSRHDKVLYKNKVNAQNYREISLVLTDLKNLDLPIEKAIKEFNLDVSDWDIALGLK